MSVRDGHHLCPRGSKKYLLPPTLFPQLVFISRGVSHQLDVLFLDTYCSGNQGLVLASLFAHYTSCVSSESNRCSGWSCYQHLYDKHHKDGVSQCFQAAYASRPASLMSTLFFPMLTRKPFASISSSTFSSAPLLL